MMLHCVGSIQEYFREALTLAIYRKKLTLTHEAQIYIVNLLSEFMRAENAFSGISHGDSPNLTLTYKRAQDAPSHQAVEIYKHLGDSSLYLSGFFAESIERKVVSKDFYVSMGERAYSSVASCLRSSTANASVVFLELADHFFDLVEILNSIRFLGAGQSPQKLSNSKILELIDAYQKNKDPVLLRALKAHGVTIPDGPHDILQ